MIKLEKHHTIFLIFQVIEIVKKQVF